MRIEEMKRFSFGAVHPASQRRDISKLKKSVVELILSFEDAADKIPEKEIYQATVYHPTEKNYRSDAEYPMGFYMKDDELVYSLGFGEKKKFQKKKLVTMIRKFAEFIGNTYQRQISFISYRWQIKNNNVELKFRLTINKNDPPEEISDCLPLSEDWRNHDKTADALLIDLERAMSNMQVETKWSIGGTRLIIRLLYTL